LILIIDNYDSFTYNLVHLIGAVPGGVRVERNDRISLDAVEQMRPSRIVISPGPGRPETAGICVELIRQFGPRIPILGVCLGHQAIGYAYGGTITHAPSLMHGKTSPIFHNYETLFREIANPFEAGRYHSLVVSGKDLPDELEVTARTADGVIMALRHRHYPIDGIQFHPESILTPAGNQIMANWLKPVEERV